MKRLFSIMFSLLVLLNVMGYYAVFVGLQYQNSKEIVQRLDADNYAASQTITLKIPLSVPYYGNTEFERVNGEIEHNGEYFRLVKQKLSNDTLHIVCIKDIRSKHINQALSDYVKTFTDHTSDTPGKTLPNFIKEYISSSFTIESSSTGWTNNLSFVSREQSIIVRTLAIDALPPEA